MDRWGAICVAMVLAIGLTATSLGAGMQTEDYMHRQTVQRQAETFPRSVNLFAYNSGDTMGIYAQKNFGIVPWLALENYKISFWRPLSSLTHHLDYRLWPKSPVSMHAHSLLWFAALIAVVGLLHRRVGGAAWAAAVATALYAMDDGHGVAVGWLASRNSVMASFFSVSAILAHLRWRDGEGLAWLGASCALLAAGLTSAELAVGAFGYLVAYAVTLDEGSRRDRWLSLVPAISVALVWYAVYRWLGHGTYGSGMYLDPLAEPLAFVGEAAWRFPALLGGMFGLPTADEWVLLDAAGRTRASLILCAAMVAIVAWALPWLREDRRARFWLIATLLGTIPVSATLPSDRLMFLPTVGSSALLAGVIMLAAKPAIERYRAGPRRVIAAGLALATLVVHVAIAAYRLPSRATTMAQVGSAVDASAESALEGHRDPTQQLVLVNAPSYYVGGLVVGVAASSGRPVPRHTRVLFAGRVPVEVARVNEHTLSLESEQGFLTEELDRVYRGRAHPVAAGDGIALSGVLAIVQETTSSGDPRAVTFQFGERLEGDRYRFMKWHDGKYVPFELPNPGQSVRLSAAHL